MGTARVTRRTKRGLIAEAILPIEMASLAYQFAAAVGESSLAEITLKNSPNDPGFILVQAH